MGIAAAAWLACAYWSVSYVHTANVLVRWINEHDPEFWTRGMPDPFDHAVTFRLKSRTKRSPDKTVCTADQDIHGVTRGVACCSLLVGM